MLRTMTGPFVALLVAGALLLSSPAAQAETQAQFNANSSAQALPVGGSVTGYNILVCGAAAASGYTGERNQFFTINRVHHYWGHDIYAGLNVSRGYDDSPGGIAYDPQYLNGWDAVGNAGADRGRLDASCDSDSTIELRNHTANPVRPVKCFNDGIQMSPGPLKSQRCIDHSPVAYPPRPGATGYVLQGKFKSDQGLRIRSIFVNDELRSYLTSYFHDCPGPGTGDCASDLDGDGYVTHTKVDHDNNPATPKRWEDTQAYAIRDGAKNWTAKWEINGNSSAYDGWSMFRGCGIDAGGASDAKYKVNGQDLGLSGPFSGWRATPENEANLESSNSGNVCTFTGAGTYYANAARKASGIGLRVFCNSAAPASRYCKGWNCNIVVSKTAQSNCETDAVKSYAKDGVYGRISSARIFVEDTLDPALSQLDIGPGAPGTTSLLGSTTQSSARQLADNQRGVAPIVKVNAEDGSGISRLRLQIPSLNVDESRTYYQYCDHRYSVPCANAGADTSNSPSLGTIPEVDRTWDLGVGKDLDQLDAGTYPVMVTIWDGAQRSATYTRWFAIPATECEAATMSNCIVCPEFQQRCTGTRNVLVGSRCDDDSDDACDTNLPVCSDAGDCNQLPDATGVFSYNLAINRRFQPGLQNALSAKDCSVQPNRDPSTFDDVSRNQIVSVTISLRGFVEDERAVGVQNLTSTFGLPSRSGNWYRTALGCAG